jgi:hypothetical protein
MTLWRRGCAGCRWTRPSVSASALAQIAARQRQGTLTIAGRLSVVLAGLWRGVESGDPVGSWTALSSKAAGAFVAAQLAGAGMASEYVAAALAVQHASRDAGPSLDVAAFAGRAVSGLDLADLLAIPAARLARAAGSGVSARDARAAGAAALDMYARTEVADVTRAATQVAMAAHGAPGYVRFVGPRCCGRCAVLSGRWYRYSSGFLRHPRCSCGMAPAARDAEVPAPAELFRQGRITDLSQAERRAVEAGADLGQVVNARRGLYVAGGQEFTTEGTTRRAVAGARMLARRLAVAGGAGPGGTYSNFGVSRREVADAAAKYGPLMQRGVPFLRRSGSGVQPVPGYFHTFGRPTVAAVMRMADSDAERVRLLTNYGYLLRPGGTPTI